MTNLLSSIQCAKSRFFKHAFRLGAWLFALYFAITDRARKYVCLIMYFVSSQLYTHCAHVYEPWMLNILKMN